jgi:hypothetical protein
MAYQIDVEVKAGVASVVTSGSVPDGSYVVTGYTDGDQATTSLSVSDTNDKQLVFVGTTHDKGV